MYSNELMLMIARFLYDEYNAEEFSFDFPDRFSDVYNDFLKENKELCDCLDDVSYVCQWYDPHNTGVYGTFGLEEFKKKVYDLYLKALPMTMAMKKIS